MDIKESNIYYDKPKNMYKVDLGFYTRFFDSLIFNKNLINKKYGENKNISNAFKTNGNYIFGFTSFFEYKYINIFNIDAFYIKDRIIFDYKLTSFNINGSDYFLLIYLDLDNTTGFYTDFLSEDFTLNIEKNKFFIKNNIFDSIVFEFNFKFDEFIKNKINKIQEYSIIDLYYFDNVYSKNNESFIDDLLKINIDYLKVNYDFQVVKFEIYNRKNKFLKELNKLFLTINNIQLLSYLPENKIIKEVFLDFENVSKLDIKNLDFNFEKPKDIGEYDEKYQLFQKNFYKLQYVLFTLKTSYKNIIETNKSINNDFKKLHLLRLDIKKEELEKNIVYFEEKFNKIKQGIQK